MSSTQDRYQTKIETRKLSNGSLVYRSLLPKKVTADPMYDMEFTVSTTHRLDKLSFEVYDSQFDWWKIVAANGNFQGSLFYPPGTKIYIPSE